MQETSIYLGTVGKSKNVPNKLIATVLDISYL